MFRRPYGLEAVFDLRDCDPARFNRTAILSFFTDLCDRIGMELCDVHFWDDEGVAPKDRQTDPDTKGTSAVAFILTSSIVVHSLDIRREVFINVFSCKWFDRAVARAVALAHFGGYVAKESVIERGA